MQAITQKLRTFILENYLFSDDPNALNDDDSFLDLGIIDSTGIMEVVMFIEGEFGLQVQDAEMLPENLDTINNLAAFIQRKQSAHE